MTPETLLVQQLSDSSKRATSSLSDFMKTAGDPGEAYTIPAMKKAVSQMKQAVNRLPVPRRDVPKTIKAIQSQVKQASVDKLKLADLWGRTLAQEDYLKTASIFSDAHHAAGAASKAAWAANQAKGGWNALRAAGPVGRAAVGGVVGGVAGHALGSNEERIDENGIIHRKSKTPAMLAGAALGAAGGALSHGGTRAAMARKFQEMSKKSSVDVLRTEMDKMAGLGQMAAGMVNRFGPAVGRGLSSISKTPWAQRTAVGAGVGAGVQGVRHFFKPKDPRTGRREGSALGSMAGGALLGGVGGLASKSIADHALGSQPVQDAMRGQWGAKKNTAQRMLPRPPAPASQQTVHAG
jgi:hypothetical protein